LCDAGEQVAGTDLHVRDVAAHEDAVAEAKANPKRIVFPEGEEEKILRAAQILIEEGIAIPVLLGDETEIRTKIEMLGLDLGGIQIINPNNSEQTSRYVEDLFNLRKRKGVTLAESRRLIRRNRNYYGSMMVEEGDADALLSGLNHHYPDTIRPALEIIGKQDGLSKVHGLYMMVFKKEVVFCADTTVNIEPTAEELAETAILAAKKARDFDVEPRVAMLSFSNFGSVEHPLTIKVRRATQLVKDAAPDLIVDGEMQANVALDPEITEKQFPFSDLKGNANVLIFPDLQSGNISYKLLYKLGGADAVGPIRGSSTPSPSRARAPPRTTPAKLRTGARGRRARGAASRSGVVLGSSRPRTGSGSTTCSRWIAPTTKTSKPRRRPPLGARARQLTPG
jgi:malate dehydrogenase (oxaloacetate-decarboxylating)(NADP+)